MNNLWRGHKETKLRNLAENDVTERQALMREAIRNTNCEGKALVMSCRRKGEITVKLSSRTTSPYLKTWQLC